MTVEPQIEDLCRLVGRVLGARSVSPDDRLVEDLGAESIDLVNVVVEVEDLYQVAIPEEELGTVATVGDLHRLLVGEG